MLRPGDVAPPFRLPDQHGREIDLQELRGGPVVVFFYPKDGTSGCTLQARELRDVSPRLDGSVLGISGGDQASHAEFAETLRLPYSLLVDADHAVCDAYDAWVEMPPSFRHGMWEGPDDARVWRGILRSLFVVGPDGRLTLVVYDVAPDGMTEAIERAAIAG